LAADLFLLMAAPASGQETDLNSADTAYVNRLTLLPAIGTSPETSLMLGGVAMQQFKPAKAGPYTRPSSLILSATYTLNNQMLFEFVPAVILPDESWIFEGSVFAYHFPDRYWGIGPETRHDDEISIEYKMFNIRQMVLKKIRPSFYAGPVMRWYYNYDFLFTDSDGREFEPADLIGSEGGSTLGFGGAVRLDKRNSIMTPTQNHFMELNVLFCPEMFGTSFRYAQYWFDARKYYDLKGDANTVLAFHTRWQITRGEVPFLDLADLGGREILRGYYQGRFRDRNSMQFQTEWRQHIKGRFGFTLFGGIGEVWPSADEFSLKNVKSAGGAGIRFNLNPGDTTNLRLDFAMGKNTKGFYLTFGEAF
jgi:hypothetical protein